MKKSLEESIKELISKWESEAKDINSKIGEDPNADYYLLNGHYYGLICSIEDLKKLL